MRRYGASLTGPSAMAEEVLDGLDDSGELRFGDPREDRQGEPLVRKRFGHWEGARPVSKSSVRSGQVRRLRIVPACSDSASREVGCEPVWLLRPDHVQVPDGSASGGHGRQPHVADTGKRLGVEGSRSPALLVPIVEKGKLPQEDERLERVEPG